MYIGTYLLRLYEYIEIKEKIEIFIIYHLSRIMNKLIDNQTIEQKRFFWFRTTQSQEKSTHRYKAN